MYLYNLYIALSLIIMYLLSIYHLTLHPSHVKAPKWKPAAGSPHTRHCWFMVPGGGAQPGRWDENVLEKRGRKSNRIKIRSLNKLIDGLRVHEQSREGTSRAEAEHARRVEKKRK